MRTALVITSINAPNQALKELADGCSAHDWDFHLAGDSKSPPDFSLEGCKFLSLKAQRESGFDLGRISPERTYTRKNIAYLHAIRNGAEIIVETDDDNHPRPSFWQQRDINVECEEVDSDGWVNVYRYFSDGFIYPRGLPLPHAREEPPAPVSAGSKTCPIQQGLADEDPDVDAVYRMLYPLPFYFEIQRPPVLLAGQSWCPFNSQNTTFFKTAFPLLYLPANCSFRMTDIWRSFVAQRILQAKSMGVLFHFPTVWQERNDHDLQKDFMDEVPGYAHNDQIREALLGLDLQADESIRVMMERCYETMIRKNWVGRGEEPLLQAWFRDLESTGSDCQ